MNHLRKYIAPFILVTSLVLLAGCNLLSSSEPVPPSEPPTDPENPVEFISFYDFADVEPGDVPSGEGWNIDDVDADRGSIVVVEDLEIESGRALHVTTKQGENASISVRFPEWEMPSESVDVVAFEYKLKHVEGTAGMYLYVNQGGGNHHIILRPLGDGRLNWHASRDGFSGTTMDDVLKPGWNTIRVIADKNTRFGDIYINDMETPVAVGLPYQRPFDSWENTRFIITHEIRANEVREAYYADFKVWAVD